MSDEPVVKPLVDFKKKEEQQLEEWKKQVWAHRIRKLRELDDKSMRLAKEVLARGEKKT